MDLIEYLQSLKEDLSRVITRIEDYVEGYKSNFRPFILEDKSKKEAKHTSTKIMPVPKELAEVLQFKTKKNSNSRSEENNGTK